MKIFNVSVNLIHPSAISRESLLVYWLNCLYGLLDYSIIREFDNLIFRMRFNFSAEATQCKEANEQRATRNEKRETRSFPLEIH